MKAPRRAVTIVIIFPPSVTLAAASLRMKNAALELILGDLLVTIFFFLLINWKWGYTYANIVSYSFSLISVIGFLRTMPTVLTTISI